MSDTLFDKGHELRKAVLGPEVVDGFTPSSDEFSGPMHQLSTEYCWGKVWARPGLSLKTRSMLNIAMLVALNRSSVLKLHVEGALRNGCTKEEIREVLLQAAVYCGIPAGQEGFKAAHEVFAELDKKVSSISLT